MCIELKSPKQQAGGLYRPGCVKGTAGCEGLVPVHGPPGFVKWLNLEEKHTSPVFMTGGRGTR